MSGCPMCVEWREQQRLSEAVAVRLAGQVAAIRALCDELDDRSDAWDGETDFSAGMCQGFSRAVSAVRAALVASSPTTPEGNQP